MDEIVVSVLLPAYNAAPFIKEAVESVLCQTYASFELIIIDDCSTDGTVAIIEQITDPRIRILKKEKNSGYTDSLNYGLQIAKGKYIARMDADDISHRERFEKQVQFLEENKDVILCGTWFSILGTDTTIHQPTDHDAIKAAMLEYNPIGHPTVMIRKKLLQDAGLAYDREKEPAEDYNLWVRAVRTGRLANIPQVLLQYRVHSSQISAQKKEKQERHSKEASQYLLQELYGSEQAAADISAKQFSMETPADFESLLQEVSRLRALNEERKIFEPSLFEWFCDKKRMQIIQDWFRQKKNGSLSNLLRFINPQHGYYRCFPNKEKINIIERNILFKW